MKDPYLDVVNDNFDGWAAAVLIIIFLLGALFGYCACYLLH